MKTSLFIFNNNYIKNRKKKYSRSPSKERVYAPPDVALELGDANVNMAQLDKKTVQWLQERINEQVNFLYSQPPPPHCFLTMSSIYYNQFY